MEVELQQLYLLLVTCLLVNRAESTENSEQYDVPPAAHPVDSSTGLGYPHQQYENSFIENPISLNPSRFSSLVEAEGQFGRRALHMLITGDRRWQWSCGCERFWRDLGEDFYPRFIRDARCRNATCYHGHFPCVPSNYTVPVLKRLTREDEVDARKVLANSEFYFEAISITTSCQCGRFGG